MSSVAGDCLLTIAIPSYNSEAYMSNAVESVVKSGYAGIEILVINDGSKDGTARIADELAAEYPGLVKAIHQENRGHGGAVNSGIEHATGRYFKVLDSDDWFDVPALQKVMETLKGFVADGNEVDLLVTNYVYEKVGARFKKVMHYRSNMPRNRIIGWEQVRPFATGKYLMMHSLAYRTEVLREAGLELPRHTFYVDNLFVNVPIPFVKTLYYLDVNLYRYYIGREDQSVNESVMIRRIDQQLKVNRLMLDNLESDAVKTASKRVWKLLYHHFEVVTVISSILLIRAGDTASDQKRIELWEDIRERDEALYRRLKRSRLGILVNLRGKIGRFITMTVYGLLQRLVGFN